MGTAFGYYLFDPAFFWFLVVMVALAFTCFGLAFGWTMGRNSSAPRAVRESYPPEWPGGNPNAVPHIHQ